MKLEKWSLGYAFLKTYIWFAFWLFQRRIVITGKKNLPKNKPVVLAPNHQNALSDPLVVLCNSPFQPIWLARADVFKSGIIKTILKYFKIVPVYRIRDGKENLVKNDKTFADSIKILENNKALALFPEAAHSGKRQMIPHKKAIPRIVFMAEEKKDFSLDIQIVPVGVYYSHYWKFGRDLIVNFGKPIPVKKYQDSYKNNQNTTTIKLKNDIFDAVLPLTLHINSKEYYNSFEKIREICSKAFLKKSGWKNKVFNRFKSDQILVKKLDNLEKENPEKTNELVQKTEHINAQIRNLGLRNWVVSKEGKNPLKFILNFSILIVSLPIFIYGFFFNIFPFWFLDFIIKKKVKDSTFWNSFSIAGGIILFPIVYIIEMICLSPYLPGLLPKILFLISLPLLGKLAFFWYIFLKKTIGRFRMIKLFFFNKSLYQKLMDSKQEIIDTVLDL